MMLNICLHTYFPNTWLFHEMSGWTIFHLDYFFSSCWVRQSLYSKYHPLMKIHCENISCHSVVCLFHSLNSIFHRASTFTLDEIFYFLWIVLWCHDKNHFVQHLVLKIFFFKKIYSFKFYTWMYGPLCDFPRIFV